MIADRILSRTGSVRNGILAASGLEPADALNEMVLVVRTGILAAGADLDALSAATVDPEVALLLRAEYHWLCALLEMIDTLSPAEDEESVVRIVSAVSI